MTALRSRFGFLFGALALLPGLVVSLPAWAEAVASGWRVGVRDGGVTRFVLDVSEPVTVRAQPRGPDRVFIDLSGVTLRLEDAPPRGGLIQRAVTTLDASGKRGIELVLTRSAQIQAASLFPPEGQQRYRLVVDLVPGTPAPVTQSAPPVSSNTPLGLSAPLMNTPVAPAPTGNAPIPLTGLGPAGTAGLPPVTETPGVRLPNRQATAVPSPFSAPPAQPAYTPGAPLPTPPAPVPPPAVPRPKVQAEPLGLPQPTPVPQESAVPSHPPGALLGARPADAAPKAGRAVYERAPYQAVRVIIPLGPPRFTPPPVAVPEADLPVIMVDAGHGGKDPGATSYSGKFEKDIVLAYARAIRAQLEATGRYRVFLTRDGDELLPLRDRVALARSESAALFISIHADALADRSVSGMSVYTLSDKASDREAEALAAKENKADIITGADLSGATGTAASILIDIAQRDSRAASRQFATQLAGELRRETAQVNNTVRSAGFAVLTAPDMPSVLLELGYLSNPEDERRILSPEFREKIAAGVVRAIDAIRPTLTRARAG